jgi:hypothetical protein
MAPRAFLTIAIVGVLFTASVAAWPQTGRDLAITHVNVIDVTSGQVKPDTTVLIEDGRTGSSDRAF